MNFSGIRARMLAAALLPVFLVVAILVTVFWLGRVSDVDASHGQRAKLMVRQVAMASEYGLFSGNVANVQGAVSAVQREPDVRSVVVFDAQGIPVAFAGVFSYKNYQEIANPQYVQRQSERGVDVMLEPITSSSVVLDDLFSTQGEAKPEPPPVLGYAVVELSRDSLRAREQHMLRVALGVGLVGLLLGGLLATQMGERVVQPIFNVSRRIKRIGQGDFSGRAMVHVNDPLYELQVDLNQMAARLAWGRDELEQRVEEATQQLRIKKEEAETATLAKSRFLAAASHDLRQPTHALGMFIARLGQLPMDTQMRQLVGSLDASVQAMQDLLDGLLDLSRLEAGAVQVQVRPFRMVDLLNALRVALGPVAADKNLRLRVRPTELWVMSDPVVLQQMVMNLAHNALRYTDCGTVLIACRRVNGGQQVRIDVLDSGIGISTEHQTEIFREFYQVGNAGRVRAHGLGLGLNIVERSARLLGHTVALRSNIGCGTRFSITVPIAGASEPPQAPVPLGAPVVSTLQGLRVLVVEDDEFSRDAMRELLDSWGCHVSAAASEAQAMAFLGREPAPDVIVSDYRLGEGYNGVSAIARLRAAIGRAVPACLMSGDTDGELMQVAKDAGLTLLHKPVRPAKLRSLLRHLAGAAAPDAAQTQD
jgi:signal transduction histidine kinase/CheY-like chemotaxis protein